MGLLIVTAASRILAGSAASPDGCMTEERAYDMAARLVQIAVREQREANKL